MAIPHAQPGQAIEVKPLGTRIAQETTVALFKSADLEVVRLVLLAGKSLSPHSVRGEITIHCIEGVIEVAFDGCTQLLHSGQMLYLAGGVSHGVKALQDVSALVTIALRK